jgi:UDP-N-acetylmuramoyl-L-alanyl-D-glutamate--2,6-diaminopimelate ligase
MRLTRLIKILDTNSCQKLSDFEVKGISCNSKAVKNDFIFVAIRGVKADGNKFILEAIDKGAKAIIVESQSLKTSKSVRKLPRRGQSRKVVKSQGNINFIKVKDTREALAKLATEFYGNLSLKIKVVGITGTNGKTTITYLIEALLKKSGFEPAVIGTINYRFKNKTIPSNNTTPGPLELQSLLSKMLKEEVTYMILEVSSHALDQDRTEGIRFHSAIFTNLTQDHLDYHKTLKNYFNAKAKLFKNLDTNSFAVINSDDEYSAKLKKITKAKIITYGIKNKADIAASNIRFDCYKTEFLLSTPKFKINLRTPLIGRHNIYNILAAVAWAENEGIDKDAIKSVIEEFSLVPGRLERINFKGDFSVFIDYAHTEDALKNIIKSLRNLSKNRIIVVFGCGGERDKTKRPKMGRVVSELSDYAIITSDNPRSENPEDIIKDIKRGIRKNNYCVILKRIDAIRKSLTLAKRGDIVLIAGKGHENYQILKNRVTYFDDRKAVRKCLQSMNY